MCPHKSRVKTQSSGLIRVRANPAREPEGQKRPKSCALRGTALCPQSASWRRVFEIISWMASVEERETRVGNAPITSLFSANVICGEYSRPISSITPRIDDIYGLRRGRRWAVQYRIVRYRHLGSWGYPGWVGFIIAAIAVMLHECWPTFDGTR